MLILGDGLRSGLEALACPAESLLECGQSSGSGLPLAPWGIKRCPLHLHGGVRGQGWSAGPLPGPLPCWQVFVLGSLGPGEGSGAPWYGCLSGPRPPLLNTLTRWPGAPGPSLSPGHAPSPGPMPTHPFWLTVPSWWGRHLAWEPSAPGDALPSSTPVCGSGFVSGPESLWV